MLTRINPCLALLALNFIAGCSAEGGAAPGGPASESSPAEATAAQKEALPAPLARAAAPEQPRDELATTELAKLSVAGSTLTFSEVTHEDGATSVLVAEDFDLVRGSVYDRLTADQGLTSLELFMSLRPNAEAPAALARYHAAEAEALGRADDRIITTAFDPNAAIEKWTSTTCDTFVFPKENLSGGRTYSNKRRLDNATGTQDLYVNDNIWTNSNVNLGVCNDGANTMTVELWSAQQGGPWGVAATTSVLAGHGAAWHDLFLGKIDKNGCVPPPPGTDCSPFICFSCPDVHHPAVYMVRGFGTKFRSRTAESRLFFKST